jgi:PAS domain S-box-containing protein
MHVDPKGRIRFVNRVVEGFRREDVVGAEWLAFVAADQHEQVTRLLQQTLATGRTTECEVLGQGDHGAPSWYWTRIAPVRHDGAITGAVLVARDITEMKLAETQLIVSDRMASLGSVVASVTHELNNSLASVVVNLELAFHDVSNLTPAVVPPELPEMLQDARDGAERVRQTVHDLRIFSRHEQDERCAVNVERVLDSTLRMAVNEIRHRARLVTSYAGVPLVDGSEGQLGHVFLNLIMNAAHAIPEGNFETNEISVTTELDATGRVLVTIAGSGPCVPADVPQRPFTPFFSATPPRPGTGLNLSIYQRIVTSLAGELSFERPSDRGTVFRVLLQRPTSSANTELATSRQLLPTRRGRVLIVDDEPAFARTFKRVLAGEHDVSISHSASGALEAFAAGQRFDVVLCDLMMPQVTGMDFFAALAGIDAEQARRVVFMTGGAFTSKARDFLASVPNQSFEKPLDLESLRAIVRSLVK